MGDILRPKYLVYKLDETGNLTGLGLEATNPEYVDSPFVLMPRKDPAAFRAMVCYANFCEPGLRIEIVDWLNKIADADPVFGSQGARNAVEMRFQEIRLGL